MQGKRAVIIGTSFIGLEAASALTQKGLAGHRRRQRKQIAALREKVRRTRREGHSHPPREARASLFRLHSTQTSSVISGQRRHPANPKDNRPQEQLAADLVSLRCRCLSQPSAFEHDPSPSTEKSGGLAIAENTLRVTDSVFVAGDIASVDGTRIEHWRLAEQHGMLAARNMLGFNEHYTGVPFFWTFHFGKRFGYLGHAKRLGRDRLRRRASKALTFLAFYIKEATK